jgi:gluconate 2-dehydrogenase gamma chain
MSIDRRHFLLGSTAAGVAGIASGKIHDGELGGPVQVIHGAVPWQEGTADSPPGVSGSGYSYFTNIEATFVEAALARLIPGDPVGPGAVEANVPFFIDRQLAGLYGRGDHLYKGGPWPKGTPEQGYQASTAKTFFAMLLQNTKEGYFSDPIYGGNKDMGAWKMIGFPGAHYDYSEWVSRHGERVPYPPGGFQGPPGLEEGQS